MLKRRSLIACLLFIGPSGLFAASPVERAVSAWKAQLPALRIEEADLAIPTAPPPYYPNALIETFFSTPTAFPPAASSWLDGVDAAVGFQALTVMADGLLGDTAPTLPFEPMALPSNDQAPEITRAAALVMGAVAAAQPALERARDSLTAEQRDLFAEMFGWNGGNAAADDELSTRRLRRRLDAFSAYRADDLRAAARTILAGFDRAVDALRGTSPSVRRRVRWKTPAGDVLIGTSGDDVYREKDLKNVTLLIEPGGNNRYIGSVAYAESGQTRLIIDLGADVSVKSDTGEPSAGAAFFGVAAMALINPAGAKRVVTGNFSQGATVGGVAAFRVDGRVEAYGGRNSQGAAVAGNGLFVGDGVGSRYESIGNGQGTAFVRGVGVFRHRGNDATVRGGLSDPDPREPLASVSLCQGVGFGRRAFSGGGIGLCSLSGDNIVALASYFAHGAGYWHAAGAFRIRGTGNTVQSRRYDMGSGVHSAFGHFESLGDRTRLLNWGVGPSYGWDRAVASAIIVGDDLETYVDWGVGTASIGSRAFGYIEGKNGKLRVGQFGSGHFFRNESAYAFQVMAGGPHRVESIAALNRHVSGRLLWNAWGVGRFDDASFEGPLNMTPPVWLPLEREVEEKRQTVNLQNEMSEAKKLGPVERVAGLADVAAAFTLDKETPRRALETLLSLPPDEVPHLVSALEPAAIEQLIQLSISLAAHGDDAARALSAVPLDHNNAGLAIHMLRLGRPTVVLPVLEKYLSSERRRAAAVRSLGALMNRDTGEEPGARAIWEAVSAALREENLGPGQKIAGATAERKRALDMLARVRLTEAFGWLSAAAALTPEQRVTFLNGCLPDVTETLREGGAAAFMKILDETPGTAERVATELNALQSAEKRLRPAFQALAASTQTAAVQAAIVAAGQMGDPADAAWIAPLLSHKRAAVRESAAVALGRMGDGGAPWLLKAVKSSSARTRAMAATGAGFATSAAHAAVLDAALSDKDPMVVAAAAAAIHFPTDALASALPALKKKAARRLKTATDRDLDINLRVLLFQP